MPKTIEPVAPPSLREAMKETHKQTQSSVLKPLMTEEEEKEFTVVARQTEKTKAKIFATTSYTLAPHTLPHDKVPVEILHPTTNILPITVKVKAANDRVSFKNTRIAVAVLRAFQLVDKTTYLAPIKEKSDYIQISKSSNIPMDAEEILEYT
jgi:hypothetical protein